MPRHEQLSMEERHEMDADARSWLVQIDRTPMTWRRVTMPEALATLVRRGFVFRASSGLLTITERGADVLERVA